MTTKVKNESRATVLDKLKAWHEEHGIVDFPKRFGISTNEKKFREVSFRVREGVEMDDATAGDIIIASNPIHSSNGNLVAYVVTYRVWMPSAGGKVSGRQTIRFNLHFGVVGLFKVGKFFVAVEHDNFALQRKSIGVARMFGIKDTTNLEELGHILLEKEYPFFAKHVDTLKVTQLGNTLFQDPTNRHEEDVFLLIELNLKESVETKKELSDLIDHRNKEMVLHHIFDKEELQAILDRNLKSRSADVVTGTDDFSFRDQYSSWALASYFSTE